MTFFKTFEEAAKTLEVKGMDFDPLDPYVKMVMEISDETLTRFFDSMGIDINLDVEDEDEGILYDCEA